MIQQTMQDPPAAEHDDAPYSFERRRWDRWPADGAATAFRLAGDGFGQMHDLRLLDCSDDGMGAQSATVVEPGTIVSIGFQTPGMVAKRGVVVRCLPCGDGYRLGIRFEGRLAA